MTTTVDFDRLLESVLESRGPQVPPLATVDAALAAAGATAQRRPILPPLDRRAWPSPRPSGRLTQVPILVVLATALFAILLAGPGARHTDPVPRAVASQFIVPFEYSIPRESAIRQTDARQDVVAWVADPGIVLDPAPEDVNVGQVPKPWDARGVVVGSAARSWSHSDHGRFWLRTDAAGFLADLRDIAHVPMGAIAETTLDGRPALTVQSPGGGSDIHVSGPITGLVQGAYVLVDLPSRLTVADVDGTTVFVLVWARTADDLATWTPVADELVASIHFTQGGGD